MTEFLTPGKIFTINESVTAAKLSDLVAKAIPKNLDRSHFGSATRPTTIGASTPAGQIPGEPFYSTIDDQLLVLSQLGLRSASLGEEIYTYVDALSHGNLTLGDVVIIDTGQAASVKVTNVSADPGVVGVCVGFQAPYVNGASARIRQLGFVIVNTTGAVNVGDYLHASTTPGLAAASATEIAGTFARAVTAETASPGTVTAILLARPMSAVPASAMILWDSSSSCPAGFTAVTGAGVEHHFLKIVDSSPHTARNGAARIAGAAVSNDDIGTNHYPNEAWTQEIVQTATPHATFGADDEGNPQGDWGGHITGGGTTALEISVDPNRQGDHQHRMNKVSNMPLWRKAMLCRKD